MKKFITFILCFALILPIFNPIPAKALEPITEYETITETNIEYLENGDYIKTTIRTYKDLTSPDVASPNATIEVKGDKVETYYNKNNERMWSITVVGTFRCVERVSATLIAYSGYGTSYNSNWKVHDVTSRKSGQIAICEGQGTHYFTVFKMETVDAYVDLRCNTFGLLL